MQYMPQCKWAKDTHYHQRWVKWKKDYETLAFETVEETARWLANWEHEHGDHTNLIEAMVKMLTLVPDGPFVTAGLRDYRIVTHD